jgi:hypothetical protein
VRGRQDLDHVKSPIAPAVAGTDMANLDLANTDIANMEVIMRTKRAILVASAVVLLGSGLVMPAMASARHHTGHLPLVSGYPYGYAPDRAPRAQYVPGGPRQGIYDSLSNGHQPYSNPDRDFLGPNALFEGGN